MSDSKIVKRKVKVETLRHKGKSLKKGETVECSPEQMAVFIKHGFVEGDA